MSHFPLSAAMKAVAVGSSNSAMLTLLGFSTLGKDIIDSADAPSALDALGFSAVGKDFVDSADAAAARAAIAAGVGFALEQKSASFTAADAKYYEVNSSGGAVTATLPSVTAGALIAFKLVVAGNNLIIDGASSENIDGNLTYTMSVAGEAVMVRGNTAGTAWILE